MSKQEVNQSSGAGQESPAAPRQLAGPVFGPNCYASVLADRIVSECHGDPSRVLVVNLHLANGRALDRSRRDSVGATGTYRRTL